MITPQLPVTAMQTYTISRPVGPQFWRKATCAEVKCERHLNGWVSKLDVGTTDGVKWARWITEKAGRNFTSTLVGQLLTLTFPAGQECFKGHRLPLERDPLFIVRGGDHRAFTGERRTHVRGEDWRDDMQETLDRVADRKRRG